MTDKQERALFWILSLAALILIAVAVSGCSHPHQMNRSDVERETVSTSQYFGDRSVGWPFRSDYYDSTGEFCQLDTNMTRYFWLSVTAVRKGDSLGTHANSFYLDKRKVLLHQLNIIHSVTDSTR